MLRRPQFKPGFRVQVVAGEGVFLVSEERQVVLSGRLYELVAPQIDGRCSVDEIAARLRSQASAAEVYYTLARLEANGYAVESYDAFPLTEAAGWVLQGVAPAAAARRLAEIAVDVRTLGDVAREPLLQQLQQMHVQVGEPAGLGLVLTDDYLRAGLEAYNRESLRTGRPWLLLKPVGAQVWIGPLFRPGRTGCWACLASRLRVNRWTETYLQGRLGRAEPVPLVRGFTPATLQIAHGLAATAVARWIGVGGSSELEGKVLTLDTITWQSQLHQLMRRPQCPACGDPEVGRNHPGRPVVLHSCRKTSALEGGQEARAAAMVRRCGHLVSPITGVVDTLVRTTPADDAVLHGYAARYNVAPEEGDPEVLQLGLRASTSGKGITDLQARASALGEALECYSSEYLGSEPRHQARFIDLASAAIHPNACMLFSDRQYQGRDAWNAACPWYSAVPLPFDDRAVMEWTPVWSLTRKEFRYLPTALCYFFSPLGPLSEPACIPTVHGKGAAETIENAVLHALLELIERDHAALWWYNRVRRPALEWDSFDEPYLHRVVEYLREHQRDLWCLDLTADVGIPVFAALSRRQGQSAEHILLGLGAHLDARQALVSAVTELSQMFSGLERGGTGETLPQDVHGDSKVLRDWLRTATLANQPYLDPDDTVPPRRATDFSNWLTDDVRDDVLACQVQLERLGLEVLVLDQTRQEVGIPVARVFVPGLQHYWSRRLAPGRLYDVPVRLGWLARPTPEEQLNPTSMFG
jgi:bacteriocin biosynthesis cyclodehydratase domain-containing protein